MNLPVLRHLADFNIDVRRPLLELLPLIDVIRVKRGHCGCARRILGWEIAACVAGILLAARSRLDFIHVHTFRQVFIREHWLSVLSTILILLHLALRLDDNLLVVIAILLRSILCLLDLDLLNGVVLVLTLICRDTAHVQLRAQLLALDLTLRYHASFFVFYLGLRNNDLLVFRILAFIIQFRWHSLEGRFSRIDTDLLHLWLADLFLHQNLLRFDLRRGCGRLRRLQVQ